MTEQHIYDAIYIIGSLGFLGLIIALVHAWLEDKQASRDDHGGQHTRPGPARWDRDILDDLRDRFLARHRAEPALCCDDIPPGVLHSHAHFPDCDDPDCHGCAPGGDFGEKPPADTFFTDPANVPASLPSSPPAALASPTPPAGGPGTLNVTVPAPPDHGTVTLQGAVRAENAVAAALLPDRALETHHQRKDPLRDHIAVAWQTAGDNQAARNWTPRDTYTDTGWTKRSALDLEIRLAREQLDRFDQILPYATSGMQPRWSAA